MPYQSTEPRLSAALLRAASCPFLIHGDRCAGGDYCHFPAGKEHRCCFFCTEFESCPDRSGICTRFLR